MTLLELTVVILVLLSLISILFISARAWKRGSDRAGCILNIRNVQQAVRSYANVNGLNANTTVPGLHALIIGPNGYLENEPACPSAPGDYTCEAPNVIPDLGVLYLACPNIAASTDHVPAQHADW